MSNYSDKTFDDKLQLHNFKKYKKYYFRLINDNVFQSIGLIKIGSFWRLTFFSIILDAYDFLEEHLKTLEIIHDGYDVAGLINQDNVFYNTKKEAMDVLNNEIIKKLNDLKDVNKHIEFFENQLFIDQGAICQAPYIYYLYSGDYSKAEEAYLKQLDLLIDTITSWRLDNIIWKEKKTKNEFTLESLFQKYLEDKEIFEKIKNDDSFEQYFNDLFQKNKTILENYYGKNN